MSTNRTLFLYVLKKTCGMFCMQMGEIQYHRNRLFEIIAMTSPVIWSKDETFYNTKLLAPMLSHKFLVVDPDRFYRSSERFFFNPAVNTGERRRPLHWGERVGVRGQG